MDKSSTTRTRKTLLLIAFVLISSGCERRIKETESPASTVSGGNLEYSLLHDGRERTYKAHVPTGYSGNSPAPLVIFLHGGGGNNESMYGNGVDKYSDKYGFIAVAPNGTGRLKDKLLTWNAGVWSGGGCCGYALDNNVDDVGFISALIDEISAKWMVDKKRVYVTGISNGGMMSYRLACELSDKLAAVASVAPPAVPLDCPPGQPISILHIHGTADPCAPFNGGPGGGCLLQTGSVFTALSAQEMVDFWLTRDGVTSDPTIIYKQGNASCASQTSGNIEVEFCAIQDGGHAWPDGGQYLPAERVGLVSHDISFDQIWDFFTRQQLP